MHSRLTTLALIVLTLLALAATAVAIERLLRPEHDSSARQRLAWWLTLATTLGATVVFAYQELVVHRLWQPLTAHVDGLLLIAMLLGAAILFIQTRPQLRGLAAFALPVLSLILAWGVCASAWTYRPFDLETLDPVWKSIHLTGVYLGTLGAAIAATAGAAYLFADHRVRRKQLMAGAASGRIASLEALEGVIVRTATLGFVLLTVGLVAGLVLHPADSSLGPGWWHSPKVLLATVAWLIYALVMNVRYATRFRGTRAAWLSIAGFVLLLATYAIVTAIPAGAGEVTS